MPKSSDVVAGNAALASDYNELRDDALRGLAVSGGTKTISGGSISLTPDAGEGYYIVAAESGSQDNLNDMSGGAEGDIVILKAATGDRITLQDSISTNGFAINNRIILEGDNLAILRFNGTSWVEVGNSKGSIRHCSINVFQDNVDVKTGDGTVPVLIPYDMAFWNLIDAVASVDEQGSTGTTDIQLRRVRSGSSVDMLSTKITIGAEYYARDGVINTSNADVFTGDKIYVDVDAVHSTPPKGLTVTLTFGVPL